MAVLGCQILQEARHFFGLFRSLAVSDHRPCRGTCCMITDPSDVLACRCILPTSKYPLFAHHVQLARKNRGGEAPAGRRCPGKRAGAGCAGSGIRVPAVDRNRRDPVRGGRWPPPSQPPWWGSPHPCTARDAYNIERKSTSICWQVPNALLACAAELSRLIFRSLERVVADPQAAGIRALLARRMHSRCSFGHPKFQQAWPAPCLVDVPLPLQWCT